MFDFGYLRITQTLLCIISKMSDECSAHTFYGEIVDGVFTPDQGGEFTLTGVEYSLLKNEMQDQIDERNRELRLLMLKAVPDMDPNWDNDMMQHHIWCISGQTESADPIFETISELWEKSLNMTWNLSKFIPVRSSYW